MASVSASVAAPRQHCLGGVCACHIIYVQSAGLVGATFLLLLVKHISLASFSLLSRCASLTHKNDASTYHSIASFIARKHRTTRIVAFTDAVLFLSSFGIILAYQAILADIVTSAVFAEPNDDESVSKVISSLTGKDPQLKVKSRSAVIFLTQPILVALSFAEKMDSLKFLNYIGALAIACIVYALSHRSLSRFSSHPIVLALSGCDESELGAYDASCISVLPNSLGSFFSALNVVSAAYTCHMNVFSIKAELADPSRFNDVCKMAMTVVFAVYGASGITGYMLFGDLTMGNVLSNFENGDIIISTSRIFIVIMSIASIPGMVLPCVKALDAQLLPGKLRKLKILSILGTSMTVALIVEDVSSIFVVVGGTTGALLSFILPGYFYLAVSSSIPNDAESQIDEKGAFGKRAQARYLFFFGMGVLMISNAVYFL